ncbi:MAG: hypothetical protein AAGA66_16035 [Bacteroidota bacterium]
MKKVVLLVGMFIAVNISIAQNVNNKWIVQVKILEFTERLDLSDEQTNQIKKLNRKYWPQFKAAKEGETKTQKEKNQARSAIMNEREVELETILDEKQMAELKVIRQEVKAERAAKRKKS